MCYFARIMWGRIYNARIRVDAIIFNCVLKYRAVWVSGYLLRPFRDRFFFQIRISRMPFSSRHKLSLTREYKKKFSNISHIENTVPNGVIKIITYKMYQRLWEDEGKVLYTFFLLNPRVRRLITREPVASPGSFGAVNRNRRRRIQISEWSNCFLYITLYELG